MRAKGLPLAVGTISLALAACASNTQTTNVDRIYVQMLTNRLAQYNQAAAELDAQIKAQTTPPPAPTMPASSPAPASATVPNPNLPNVIMSDAEIHARATVLTHFMHEAAASGQFGLMSSWLQTQAQDLQRVAQTTDAKVSSFQQQVTKNPNDPTLGSEMLTLLVERGTERGAGEELMAIGNDLQGYERDYGLAAAADEKRRQDTVRLLAAYLSAPRVNVQAPVMPRFTTCQSNFVGGMNCISQ